MITALFFRMDPWVRTTGSSPDWQSGLGAVLQSEFGVPMGGRGERTDPETGRVVTRSVSMPAAGGLDLQPPPTTLAESRTPLP
jgi:hypothetical protein